MSGWLAGALARRLPSPLLWAIALAVGLGKLAVIIARRPWLLWSLASALLLTSAVLRSGPATVGAILGALVVAVGVAGAAWSWLAPDSWGRRVGGPWRSWRRGRHYRARWEDAVLGCHLDRAGVLPELMSVRSGAAGVDRLLVHMAPGSLAADWRDAAPRLASGLEVRSVRARAEGPRDVLLLARWREVRRRDPVWPAELEAEATEVAEQLTAERQRGGFPRRPS